VRKQVNVEISKFFSLYPIVLTVLLNLILYLQFDIVRCPFVLIVTHTCDL